MSEPIINPEWVKCLEHDIEAYRGALGYSIPGDHNGKLSDGSTPTCGICHSEYTLKTKAIGEEWLKDSSLEKWFPFSAKENELIKWLMEKKYRHLIHRHDGCIRAVDEALNVNWESDKIGELMKLILDNPATEKAP